MKMSESRPIVYKTPAVLIGLLLAVFLVYASGCSGLAKTNRDTKKLYKGLNDSQGVCDKTLLFLPFDKEVNWLPADLDASLALKLAEKIEKECSKVHTILPDDPTFPDRFTKTPRLAGGDPDSAALAADGRASGINMVLSGRLASIRHVTEDRGMFWFAKTAHIARLQLEMAVIHTGTGAKLIDTTIFRDIDISEEEAGLINAAAPSGPTALPEALTDISEELADISEELGNAICKVLSHIPWESYVTGVENSQVVLSAGEACGLEEGMILTVYTAREVAGEDGSSNYIAPGETAGTVTVTAVHPDYSEAARKTGGPFLPGSIVRAD
jgi:hypothetical protein